MRNKEGCSSCRHQQTGWDGGFFGLPMTCECAYFGTTENRENCSKFRRPFPKGFDLLVEFQKWFNKNRTSVCMDQKFEIEYEDLLRFRKEWK